MTWIPPFTPFVMMNRAAFPPGAWTYVLTTVVMLVSIYVALRIAARVFETGMLMTGQPPRVRQMMAMLRRGSHP
jgi:ABC-type Na+ efflux pump permease subunit